jgi:hypothetical protein
MLIKFTAQHSVRYLQIQSAHVNFYNKLMGKGSEVSRGRQLWESRNKKAFRLTRVSVKRSSNKRDSTVPQLGHTVSNLRAEYMSIVPLLQ